MSPAAANSLSPFGILLGSKAQTRVEVGTPVLAGPPVEHLFGPTRSLGSNGPLELFETVGGEWLLGVASVGVTPGVLESETRAVYLGILNAAQGMHLARIWNYVPAINEEGAGGLENYRVFCRGRSHAFEQRMGLGFGRNLPSASAVGTDSSHLTVVFAASRSQPRHFENPLQVPAYEYPSDYGPRSPSFSRATVVRGNGAGASAVFISGTAAIRGHATVATGRMREQLDCTLENLESIAIACGSPLTAFPGHDTRTRSIKVYLRDALDQPVAAQMLQSRLLRAGDAVSYLRADICRRALSVEIEVSIIG